MNYANEEQLDKAIMLDSRHTYSAYCQSCDWKDENEPTYKVIKRRSAEHTQQKQGHWIRLNYGIGS